MAWFIPALVAGAKALGLGAAATGGKMLAGKMLGAGQQGQPTMAGAIRSGTPKLASQHPIFPVPTQPMRVITLAELLGVQPISPVTHSRNVQSNTILGSLGGR